MDKLEKDRIRMAVRTKYGEIAQGSSCGCSPSCCRPADAKGLVDMSLLLGYSQKDIASAPEGSNMGLGCGNPQAIASLKPGETVLDLGSGAGFDCFLAARAVGDGGHVIGVDMTPEMVAKARENAAKGGFENVEFRLGELEHLPVADRSVDVIISNCVINLSPDKESVFKEAFRVLKPGGRLAVSDIVARAELPDHIKKDMELHAACIAGASTVRQLTAALRSAGFENIEITTKEESAKFIAQWVPGGKIEDYVVSCAICAVKPL